MGQKKTQQSLPSFDVYEQEDGALVVLHSGDEPEYPLDPVWSGEAKDEKDAIKQARKSDRAYKNAPVANPAHDPDIKDDTRQLAEAATNKRLGITPRSTKKKVGRPKKTATAKRAAVRSAGVTRRPVKTKIAKAVARKKAARRK